MDMGCTCRTLRMCMAWTWHVHAMRIQAYKTECAVLCAATERVQLVVHTSLPCAIPALTSENLTHRFSVEEMPAAVAITWCI
eukprot:scaffold87867_cov59-Phaeocystis_antarctica.AAC.4